MITFILICLIWYIIGMGSLIYWWTKDDDFTTNQIPILILVGLSGPFTFLVGWIIHGDHSLLTTKVLFKKRS